MNRRMICVAAAFVLALSGCNRGDHPAQVGKPAPDFTLSEGSNSFHLSAYKGQVVVLNFWKSDCAPCIQEEPGLKQLHHDMPWLMILGVSEDEDPAAYQRFVTRFQVETPNVMDHAEKAAGLYHIDGWPETYIIDRQGIVRRKVVGDPDWGNPEIRAFLKTL